MKKLLFSAILSVLLLCNGCQNLEMNPLSQGSSENWFSNEEEFDMAVNQLYQLGYWWWETNRIFHADRFSDDYNQRETVYEWWIDNFTADNGQLRNCWSSTYAGVARANTVLENVAKARSKGDIPEAKILLYEAEASFFRACFYSYLIFMWGDVPFYTDYLLLEDAFKMGRTDKNVILKQIYADFDKAIAALPLSYAGLQRVTKGAAYAFKARTAIWMLDWPVAAAAAEACMKLNVYSLHPNFGELFLEKTRTSPELIFSLPRSRVLMGDELGTASFYPRLPGGTAYCQPSWELFCSFTCTDGLPIDKSPLYDRKNPFKNRDPRLRATAVEFGSVHLGYVYDPGARTVLRVSTNTMVNNNDSRLLQEYASYNGLALKKGVDEAWMVDKATDFSQKIMRYGDVLLMYAEAKMEMNQIDASVLQAINMVRARGYGVGYTQTDRYPAVTETNQGKLRTILRTERRVELAWEGRRWFDLVRWHLAEVALTRPVYAHPRAANLQAIIDSDDYFFPKGVLPVIDENGLVDLSPLFATGKIIKVVDRSFNKNRQYLLPIPSNDMRICPNITQNPGY